MIFHLLPLSTYPFARAPLTIQCPLCVLECHLSPRRYWHLGKQAHISRYCHCINLIPICLRSRASNISLFGILVTIGFPPRDPIDMLYKLFSVLIGPASEGPVGAKSSVSCSPSTSINAYSVANPRHILVFPTQDIALMRSGIFNSFIENISC